MVKKNNITDSKILGIWGEHGKRWIQNGDFCSNGTDTMCQISPFEAEHFCYWELGQHKSRR